MVFVKKNEMNPTPHYPYPSNPIDYLITSNLIRA